MQNAKITIAPSVDKGWIVIWMFIDYEMSRVFKQPRGGFVVPFFKCGAMYESTLIVIP